MADQINPLREVAVKVGGVVAGLVGVVGAAVQLGFLSSEQSDAVIAAGQQLPNVVLYVGAGITLVTGIVSGIWGAFHTAKAGENHVTPVVSPRDNEGNQLGPVADVKVYK
jgi:hypothetical protein